MSKKSENFQRFPGVPNTCGECDCIVPVKVPLPYGRLGIQKGQYVIRYRCGADHYTAMDNEGNRTAVSPHEPPPVRGDGTSFCPKVMGYQERFSVSRSTKLKGAFAGHNGEDAISTYQSFPVDKEGFRCIPRRFSCNNQSLVNRMKKSEKIRIVTDLGTVLAEHADAEHS